MKKDAKRFGKYKAKMSDPIGDKQKVFATFPYRHSLIREIAENISSGKRYTIPQLRAKFTRFLTREWIVRDLFLYQKHLNESKN